MLNTQKLLYILPDVAYVAELLPGKKEHSFTIQSFRQINGEFINEDEDFIPENIDKLFSKIEPETYHLVLPDFLFTNTIMEVKDTNENKVKQYIKEDLLPKLEITKDTHEIETFSLTQYNGTTKVQLTALETAILDPIVVAANAHKVTIEHISPLTWTIKAVVSLEPSISVLQIGSMLYAAEHYIGVDQCTFSKVDEIENIVDTIKTLKGSQPSIQTVYLLSNSLVEDKLKDQVSDTLPIQQLASSRGNDDQMPGYVKQIIESGMKTLDIPDFPVPSFTLPKTPQGDVKAVMTKHDDDEVEEVESPVMVPPVAPDKKPNHDKEVKEMDEVEEESEEPLPPPKTDSAPLAAGVGAAAALSAPASAMGMTKGESLDMDDEPSSEKVTAHDTKTETLDDADDEPKTAEPEIKGSSIVADDSTIARLAGHPEAVEDPDADQGKEDSEVLTTGPARPVIKNKSGGSNLMKMAFVSLTVFALTVAVGIGIGYAVLNLNKNGEGEVASPVTSPSPLPSLAPVATTSATPVASSSANTSSIDKKTYKILVVNATTTPGYAGTTSSKLKAAGFTQVTAKNATGEYEDGFYVLLANNDPATVEMLSEASDLDLTFDSGKTTEDPSNQYDAVIVLAK